MVDIRGKGLKGGGGKEWQEEGRASPPEAVKMHEGKRNEWLQQKETEETLSSFSRKRRDTALKDKDGVVGGDKRVSE